MSTPGTCACAYACPSSIPQRGGRVAPARVEFLGESRGPRPRQILPDYRYDSRTVATCVRAWRPHRRWWSHFLPACDYYASDGLAASYYVERKSAEIALVADTLASAQPLDPALVVASAAFESLDRERV